MAADLAPRLDPAPAPTEPAIRPASPWGAWAGGLLAMGLLAAALLQLKGASTEALATVRSLSPAVWAVFAILYLIQPAADFVIYRRLWRLPAAGFGVMARKVVINETILGYSGEAYFYLWARRRPGLSRAPFGAVKDVNLISALAANVLILLMLPTAIVALEGAGLARQFGPAVWPGLLVVVASFGVLLFARQVFSLTRRELAFVSAAHAVRLAAATALTLLLWSLALPEVSLAVWWVLMTGRLVLARVPFLANKDLLFANLLLALFGPGSPTALLLATLAIVTLIAHIAVAALTGAPELARILTRFLPRRPAIRPAGVCGRGA